jgi:hydrogenase expression/formation protein HypC
MEDLPVCLAVPAEVIQIEGGFAQVDFGGVRRRIGMALVPEAKPGDYVLVHAGMAVQVIDLEEAQSTLQLLREVYQDLSLPETGGEAPPDD